MAEHKYVHERKSNKYIRLFFGAIRLNANAMRHRYLFLPFHTHCRSDLTIGSSNGSKASAQVKHQEKFLLQSMSLDAEAHISDGKIAGNYVCDTNRWPGMLFGKFLIISTKQIHIEWVNGNSLARQNVGLRISAAVWVRSRDNIEISTYISIKSMAAQCSARHMYHMSDVKTYCLRYVITLATTTHLSNFSFTPSFFYRDTAKQFFVLLCYILFLLTTMISMAKQIWDE